MSTDVTMEEAGAKEKLVVVEPGEDSVASLKTESQVTDPVSSWVLDSPTKDMRDVKPSTEVVKELEVQGKEQAALVEGSGDAAILNLQEEVRLAMIKGKRTHTVSVPTTRKSAATANAPVRKISRNGGMTSMPVMERAQKLTAEKNLETGTSFVILGSRLDGQLPSVIQDRCVIFNPSMGSVSEIISLVRAKEQAQAALAEAAYRKERMAECQAARDAAASPVVAAGSGEGAGPSVAPAVEKEASPNPLRGRVPLGKARKAGLVGLVVQRTMTKCKCRK
jgi:hypothetical protein